MAEHALGLVETQGLVAALEAADAMLKTSEVVCVGKEITDAALVTIKIAGEVAAVRTAVEAGRAAAERVGKVVSTHVIPRPHDEVEAVVYSSEERSKLAGPGRPEKQNDVGVSAIILENLSLAELRDLASGVHDFPLSPSQISRASKASLLEHLRVLRSTPKSNAQ